MKRTLATLLLPLATLSACATLGGDSAPLRSGDVGTVSARYTDPMRVRLLEDGGGELRVQLNRPAHTAIFEIFPGEGVALLTPELGARGFLTSGSTRLFAGQARRRIWAYDNVRAHPYAFASGLSRPRHLLVIASERPLRTERFERSPGLLRRAMGTTRYTSLNSRRVVDDLLATVVPVQRDESWDADVITIWPDALQNRHPAGELYRVQCRGGSTAWVPLELANAACRNPDRVLPRTPPIGADSTETPRKPDGTRPQPEGETENDEPREGRLARMSDELRSYRRGGLGDGESSTGRDLRIAELRHDLGVRRTLDDEAGGGGRLRPAPTRIDESTDYSARHQRAELNHGFASAAGTHRPEPQPASPGSDSPRPAQPASERPAQPASERPVQPDSNRPVQPDTNRPLPEARNGDPGADHAAGEVQP